MTELSEIQLAMCKVIKECGFEGLNKVKRQHFDSNLFDVSITNTGEIIDNGWAVNLDGNKLNKKEYEAWVKQND